MTTICNKELAMLRWEGCIPNTSEPFRHGEILERLQEDPNHYNKLKSLLIIEYDILQDMYRQLYRLTPKHRVPGYNMMILRLYFNHYKGDF